MKQMKISDIVQMAMLLLISFQLYKLGDIKPTVVTKTEYVPIDREVVKTIAKVNTVSKDTVIYVHTEKRTIDTLNQVQIIHDSIIVEAGQKLYKDTINLDSMGNIYGFHILDDDLTNQYIIDLKHQKTTIKETRIHEPIKLYLNSQIGIDHLGVGLTLATKKIELGYNYEILNNRNYIRVGYNLFNNKIK